MRYEAPKYEISAFESEEVLASSENYEINEGTDESGNKTGNVIMTAFNLFK